MSGHETKLQAAGTDREISTGLSVQHQHVIVPGGRAALPPVLQIREARAGNSGYDIAVCPASLG